MQEDEWLVTIEYLQKGNKQYQVLWMTQIIQMDPNTHHMNVLISMQKGFVVDRETHIPDPCPDEKSIAELGTLALEGI